jgi:hypothetical protein
VGWLWTSLSWYPRKRTGGTRGPTARERRRRRHDDDDDDDGGPIFPGVAPSVERPRRRTQGTGRSPARRIQQPPSWLKGRKDDGATTGQGHRGTLLRYGRRSGSDHPPEQRKMSERSRNEQGESEGSSSSGSGSGNKARVDHAISLGLLGAGPSALRRRCRPTTRSESSMAGPGPQRVRCDGFAGLSFLRLLPGGPSPPCCFNKNCVGRGGE